jgi:hypothetical protein
VLSRSTRGSIVEHRRWPVVRLFVTNSRTVSFEDGRTCKILSSLTSSQAPESTRIPPRARVGVHKEIISVHQGYTTGVSRQRRRPAGKGPVICHMGPAAGLRDMFPRLHLFECRPTWSASGMDLIGSNLTGRIDVRAKGVCPAACWLIKVSRSHGRSSRAKASSGLGILHSEVWGKSKSSKCVWVDVIDGACLVSCQ